MLEEVSTKVPISDSATPAKVLDMPALVATSRQYSCDRTEVAVEVRWMVSSCGLMKSLGQKVGHLQMRRSSLSQEVMILGALPRYQAPAPLLVAVVLLAAVRSWGKRIIEAQEMTVISLQTLP
jgi:hypothetical protein